MMQSSPVAPSIPQSAPVSQPSPLPGPGPVTAKPGSRLAIVSTYDELCGIAGYTRALVRQLGPEVAVEVFDLDQYYLRSPYRRVQKLGTLHIREIARQLAPFDSVNIQMEHGTLGRMPWQIFRRFRALARAPRSLSVTFHTVLSDEPMPWDTIGRQVRSFRVGGAINTIVENRRAAILCFGIYNLLRRMQRWKHVSIIVHTKRDMRLLRDVYRLKNVHHHPLSFIAAEEARALRREATRAQFPILRTLPDGTKLVGVFGFLSEYKGFETAIRALRYLPGNYHLAIFGGIHPQTIKRRQKLDPYIDELLHDARIGQTVLDSIKESGASATLDAEALKGALLEQHPQDLHARVHFMGVLADADFAAAMAVCDTVVLPYLEVGQSSSGPISVALDMGCRIIASRTAAFLQFARYHPGQVEFFDIGNFAELATRLAADSPIDCAARAPEYNTVTNAALYLQANGLAGRARAPMKLVRENAA